MPRFYWFTFLGSLWLGIEAYYLYLSYLMKNEISLVHPFLITITLGLIYVNEKKAMFENLLNRKVRQTLTAMMLITLVVFWLVVWLRLI